MTPAARVAAAIELLDRVAAGEAAEKVLTNWARGARYAGSKDRAAVRDHVFDALRCWRSAAAMGGGQTGRARMLGLLRMQGIAPEPLFTGEGHAPARLTDKERTPPTEPCETARWDLPDWLIPLFRESLDAQAFEVARALRHRADVYLRVNVLKGDLEAAREVLLRDGIRSEPHPLASTALRVTEGARKVARSTAYQSGLVELQDVASQAVVEALPLQPDHRVLDYCAGGGGKTLALAARLDTAVEAHDADARRMADLPARAARAGAAVTLARYPQGQYDLVLCDVPCTGSGAWRRSPEGKWRLTPDRLAELERLQSGILDRCSGLVKPGGILAYATCSVLAPENLMQVDAFLGRHSGWKRDHVRQFLPLHGGDGFFVATLRQK